MYSNILVPIDMSHESSWQLALSKAVELAQECEARIHVMTVIPGNPLKGFYPDVAGPELQVNAKRKLAKIVRACIPSNVPGTTSVRCGGIFPEILDMARTIPADLIVMASHEPEMKDYLLGSHSAHIVLHAPCSVLVVRGKPHAKDLAA